MFWQKKPMAQPTTPLKLNGGRVFEVVGEGSYQRALDTICGGKCEDGYQMPKQATLVPEPANPHDRNAVAVFIDGHKVAYIPRGEAPPYQKLLLGLARRGFYCWCDATIVGGWLRGKNDEGHYGVKLDLADARHAVPR